VCEKSRIAWFLCSCRSFYLHEGCAWFQIAVRKLHSGVIALRGAGIRFLECDGDRHEEEDGVAGNGAGNDFWLGPNRAWRGGGHASEGNSAAASGPVRALGFRFR
jgi:hypothetical protein